MRRRSRAPTHLCNFPPGGDPELVPQPEPLAISHALLDTTYQPRAFTAVRSICLPEEFKRK